jgi:electron transport complex protein RnfG
MRIAIEKNAKFLTTFAVACTAIVALVHFLTKDRIQQQAQQKLLSTLHSIIEPTSHNNDMYHDCVLIQDDNFNGGKPQKAYLATMDSQPQSAALTYTVPDGYNGKIELLVAMNINNLVSGVRVLQHQETPGLGDKIELRRSNWINSFSGKSIESDTDSRWAVVKDGGMFDQFTGATITPRAIVKGVKETALYFKKHKDKLFIQTQYCFDDRIQSSKLNVQDIDDVLATPSVELNHGSEDTTEKVTIEKTDMNSSLTNPTSKKSAATNETQ